MGVEVFFSPIDACSLTLWFTPGFFFVKAVAVESRNSIPVSRMPFFIYVCGWGGLGWMELGKGGAKEE